MRIRVRGVSLPALKKPTVTDDLASPIQSRRLAWVAIAAAACLRLFYAARVDLLPEETYYWNYSQHLDIGYLDHPPMVAWLIRCGTQLLGSTELGVRCGALCCGALAALYLYRLSVNLFGEAGATATLVLALVLPYFFLSGVLMTPDAPLAAAWAAALFYLERALIDGRAGAWLGAGLAMGVGLLSKYTIGLLGVGTLVFMLLDTPSHRWFRRWEPYAAVLLMVCVFTPVIVWNAEHHWASFMFQTARRLAEAPRFSLQRLVGAALVLLTPIGALAAGFALWPGAPAPSVSEPGYPGGQVGLLRAEPGAARGARYLKFAVAVPVAVFAVFSLRHDVKLDWTGAPWTGVLPLLGPGLLDYAGNPRPLPRWLRAAWPPTLIGLLALYGVGWFYLVIGIPGLGYSSHTELLPVAWRQFAQQIDAVADDVRSRRGDRLLIVGMDRYAIASELSFYADDPSKAITETCSGHLFGGMGLMYEQWFPVESQAGRPLLLVAWEAADIADSQLGARAIDLQPIHSGELTHDGALVRRYYYRVVGRYSPDLRGLSGRQHRAAERVAPESCACDEASGVDG